MPRLNGSLRLPRPAAGSAHRSAGRSASRHVSPSRTHPLKRFLREPQRLTAASQHWIIANGQSGGGVAFALPCERCEPPGRSDCISGRSRAPFSGRRPQPDQMRPGGGSGVGVGVGGAASHLSACSADSPYMYCSGV
ncbi:hypothetical protein EYF80_056870 [Liparis tanakae]|uniref:Uncharacterized protein n=1 Tax=Liparis tanakae TaxID=230148 RepID=A0A4Z2EVQ1_9TELE|nr:hypothetical protein EYF80_056870 [Liparis tanakae]